jgi:HEAT repeat protein
MAINDPSLKRSRWLREIDLALCGVVLMGALVIGSRFIGSSPVAHNIILLLMGVGAFLVYVRVRSLSRNMAQARRAPASQSAGEEGPAGSRAPPLFQLRIWDLAVLVAIYALIFGVQRYIDDQFGLENAPARGLRALHSSDPATRAWGALQLDLVFIMDRPAMPTKQVEAVAGALLAALDDNDASVRETAARGVLHVVMHYQERSQAVPGLQAIVAGLARSLSDPASPVRWHAALALANIYPPWANTNFQVLPSDAGSLIEVLGQALRDPDPGIRTWASQVLSALAARLGGPPPPVLVAALEAPEAATRAKAAEVVGHFKNGLDPILPTLLRMLERDSSPDVRDACNLALSSVKFTSAAVPALVAGLRSPERRARFIAASRLSDIVPRAVDAVPDLLPLLNESFEPQTPFERNQPEYSDPAVAACWALYSIAPGSAMAGRAEAALTKLLLDSKHPWRSSQALEALGRIRAAAPDG